MTREVYIVMAVCVTGSFPGTWERKEIWLGTEVLRKAQSIRRIESLTIYEEPFNLYFLLNYHKSWILISSSPVPF